MNVCCDIFFSLYIFRRLKSDSVVDSVPSVQPSSVTSSVTPQLSFTQSSTDGTMIAPEGSMIASDGSLLAADGTILAPPGSVTVRLTPPGSASVRLSTPMDPLDPLSEPVSSIPAPAPVTERKTPAVLQPRVATAAPQGTMKRPKTMSDDELQYVKRPRSDDDVDNNNVQLSQFVQEPGPWDLQDTLWSSQQPSSVETEVLVDYVISPEAAAATIDEDDEVF